MPLMPPAFADATVATDKAAGEVGKKQPVSIGKWGLVDARWGATDWQYQGIHRARFAIALLRFVRGGGRPAGTAAPTSLLAQNPGF